MSDRSIDGDRRARDAWIRALKRTAPIAQAPKVTLPAIIDNVATRSLDSLALIGESHNLSYRELADRTRRYAGWALRQGIARGDVVCLLMRNCPEYMAIWLGITRVGGVVALINTQLVDTALVHALNIVSPTHIVVGGDLTAAITAVMPRLVAQPLVWVHGQDQRVYPRIDDNTLDEPDPDRVDAAAADIRDRALCIYTSGTTGLPKAANISHFRILQWSCWFAGMMDAGPSDRMYNCLPMYHSVGGVVATGAMLVSRGSVVLRERFSASNFWHDVVASECTVFQYIGELCRYLVNSPPHPGETAHKLRLACGNGLRPDVWAEFRRRFRIPQHIEFYAATEANFSLYNCEGEPGSIGRIPPFLAHRFPVALVRFDVETGEPVRDPAGLCVRCGPDEVGEAISKIPEAHSDAGSPFEGYTDRDASARKILRDVFTQGDAWYRAGDLMRKDARDFFYFVDRIGDTFRWRGENVSTTQVAETIATCPGIVEAVVYGVTVPGADGRAGMAAVVAGADFDLAQLHRHLAAALPDYARPLFLRVCGAIAVTTTFKQQKQQLAVEGFDPRSVADPLYLDDRGAGHFVRLDPVLRDRTATGNFRF
jgi:fatty-acyl-CoA synthase